MSPDKNPIEDAVEQAFDAFVYAPIGLLFDGPARFPKLVRNGRNQVTNARMMGEFAVQMGRAEAEKRVEELDGPLVEVLKSFGVVSSEPSPTTATKTSGAEQTTGTQPTPKKATAKKATAKSTAKKGSTKKMATKKPAAKKRSTKKTTKKTTKSTAKTPAKKTTAEPAAPVVGSLPIPDYDSLSASQVVSRLRGLAGEELESLRRYESANRARKTILSRIQQLQQH